MKAWQWGSEYWLASASALLLLLAPWIAAPVAPIIPLLLVGGALTCRILWHRTPGPGRSARLLVQPPRASCVVGLLFPLLCEVYAPACPGLLSLFVGLHARTLPLIVSDSMVLTLACIGGEAILLTLCALFVPWRLSADCCGGNRECLIVGDLHGLLRLELKGKPLRTGEDTAGALPGARHAFLPACRDVVE